MTVAITRKISPRFNECEITHIERTPIDLDIARAQHDAYVRLLADLGCQVIELPEEPDLPDSVFVEDAAFILPEAAVITRPGADSRKPETQTIIPALAPYRPLLHVAHPATLDGGDALVAGKNIFIGLSTRSNREAVDQLNSLLGDYGYKVWGVKMTDCLHLKTAVTCVDDATLLINKNWVDASNFPGFDLIEVDASEPFAANCLPVRGKVIYPTTFPKTQKRLEERGGNVAPIDLSELAKAEGAVTCCSLIVE
ncbi:MAG: dimethylargininase [Chloroflexi bacterium]|nr:dimethylargininase [Chloroflexi bacterium CFX1]MCK6566498.1 arginine deiminase family protein [Anaerolineales bacterium]MCQ3952035.1 dimethylargininase [Chloroflexota bacterium]MDL1918104.1 dimethylargininase [Chloroflexi bacterium CFX5]NUQ59633.1 dimethylargininase [Anaerolineales bacterium]